MGGLIIKCLLSLQLCSMFMVSLPSLVIKTCASEKEGRKFESCQGYVPMQSVSLTARN